MATALKLKRDINKLKAALRSKATPKSFIPKLKSQLEKAESDYEAVRAGKKTAPRASSQAKSTLDKLKQLIKKKKYGKYQGQGVDLERDADKPALPTGKRISKNGNTYYEYRANRIDVKQPPKRYPKLADGGFVSKGEKVWNKISNSEKMQFLKENFTPEITPRSQEGLVGKSYKFLPRNVKIKFEAKYANVEEYAKGGEMAKGGLLEVGDLVMVDDSGYAKLFSGFDTTKPAKIISKEKKKVFGKIKYFYGLEMADGRKPFNNAQESMLTKVSEKGGYMAKGGETTPYIVWVSKDGETREYFGEYKSQRAAEMAMKKLWENGEYDAMGNRPKSTYEKEGLYEKGGYMADGGELAEKLKELQKELKFHETQLKVAIKNNASEKIISFQKDMILNTKIKIQNIERRTKMADGGMTPLDLSNQIYDITVRIAELGDINTEAAYEETKNLMKMRAALQARALHLQDMEMASGGYMEDGGVIYLESVGTYFRPSDLATSAEETFTNEGEIVDLADIDNEEWWDALSEEDRATIEKYKAEGGMMAKGGDLSSIKKKYEENEDENAHSENVVLLAKHFGTKEDLAKAKEILAVHEKEGSLSSENGKKRQELHLKLIGKAKAEMGKQGIEFEKGGYMAKGGELHRSQEIAAKGMFVKSEFNEILVDASYNLYKGLNDLDLAARYLEVNGQAGAVNAFKQKVEYWQLKEIIEKIDEEADKK
jgi:hypothetical protein